MIRMVGLVSAISALMLQVGFGDEIRRTSFAGALVGTWAQTADLCNANDKSNLAISATKFTYSGGACSVDWIVETPGEGGPNYAVHAVCADPSQPSKTAIANLIIRPQGNDRISVGKTFDDLTIYQRCPAR